MVENFSFNLYSRYSSTIDAGWGGSDLPGDTAPAPGQSCHQQCPQGTAETPRERVKASCSQPPEEPTACLRNQQITHTPQMFFFSSFFFPLNMLFYESWAVLCMLTSHCERHFHSGNFFLKEWSKISGQKVTLAHLFLDKDCFVKPISFYF